MLESWGPLGGHRSRHSKPKYASGAGNPIALTMSECCAAQGFQQPPRSPVRMGVCAHLCSMIAAGGDTIYICTDTMKVACEEEDVVGPIRAVPVGVGGANVGDDVVEEGVRVEEVALLCNGKDGNEEERRVLGVGNSILIMGGDDWR